MEKHNFNSENTKILSTKSKYMDQNTKEVIKTELDPNNVFSRSWKLLIHSLMEQRKTLEKIHFSKHSFHSPSQTSVTVYDPWYCYFQASIPYI